MNQSGGAKKSKTKVVKKTKTKSKSKVTKKEKTKSKSKGKVNKKKKTKSKSKGKVTKKKKQNLNQKVKLKKIQKGGADINTVHDKMKDILSKQLNTTIWAEYNFRKAMDKWWGSVSLTHGIKNWTEYVPEIKANNEKNIMILL